MSAIERANWPIRNRVAPVTGFPNPACTTAARCTHRAIPRKIPGPVGKIERRSIAAPLFTLSPIEMRPYAEASKTTQLRELTAGVIPQHPADYRSPHPVLRAQIAPVLGDQVARVPPRDVFVQQPVDALTAGGADRPSKVKTDRVRREVGLISGCVRRQIEVSFLTPGVPCVPIVEGDVIEDILFYQGDRMEKRCFYRSRGTGRKIRIHRFKIEYD